MPRVFVDLSGRSPRAVASRVGVLRPGELTRLLSTDTPVHQHPILPTGYRLLPLADQRWATACGHEGGIVWRIVDREDDVLEHPMWLWLHDWWFDPDRTETGEGRPDVRPLPLRTLVRLATPLGGSRRNTIKALARAVTGIRRGRKTVAIITPEATLSAPSEPGKWFCLALLCCLPPSLRDRLRISTYEASPQPEHWDLVLTDTDPGDGFDSFPAEQAAERGQDMVSYYLRNRLQADDPEAVEAAAHFSAGSGPDPWGEGVKAKMRAGIRGVSDVDGAMVERDPEGSVRALVARIRSGAEIDDGVAKSIAQVTEHTGDARPWRALVSRSSEERARVVKAWLPLAEKTRPNQKLLRTIAAIYPREMTLDPWYTQLLRWFRDGFAVTLIPDLLAASLLDEANPSSLPDRASIWLELVLTLARRDRSDDALSLLLSPVGKSLAEAGAARSLVHGWLALPTQGRGFEDLGRLLDYLVDAPDGDQAAALLFLHQQQLRSQRHVDALLQHWAKRHLERPLRRDDALLEALTTANRDGDWVRALATVVPAEHIRNAVADFVTGPADEMWIHAEAANAMRFSSQPRERFIALRHFIPDGVLALEPVARSLIGDALTESTLPDPALCHVATLFTEVEVSSAIWKWVAVAAAPPNHFEESLVDATVMAFCEFPPLDALDRAIAERCAAQLGRSEAWETIDLARWIVRFAMAPDGDETGFNFDLAAQITRGAAETHEGHRRLADVTNALAQLPDEHPALWVFLQFCLPATWGGEGAPSSYRNAVDQHRMTEVVRGAWEDAVTQVRLPQD